MREDLDLLQSKIGQLKADCEQYVGYASDAEERESIINAKNGLESLGKQTSTAQVDGVNKELTKLKTLINDLKTAVNKEEVMKSCVQLFLKIEKKFHEVESNMEEGWKV